MPNPLEIMPDDELAIIQYLRGVPEVTALVPGTRITSDLPDKPIYPVVLIQRVGGTPLVWQHIDEPAIQIDVVGGTRYECKKLALTVRAAILSIANYVVPEAVLSSAYEEVGPAWLPDTIPIPPIPRFTSRYRVLIHK